MTPNNPVQYRLADGTIVIIPREPIERAGLPIPGPVTRPDGSVIWVEDFDQKSLATFT